MLRQQNSSFTTSIKDLRRSPSRSLLFLFCVGLIFTLITSSCDQDEQATPKPLEFEVTPNDQLRTMVQETPSDFTWEYFGDNMIISLRSEADWEGELVMSGFKIVRGEIVDRVNSESNNSNSAELLDGLSSEVVFRIKEGSIVNWGISNARWETEANSFDANWSANTAQAPIELWTTPNSWSPSELESGVLNEFEALGPDTLYVVYARLAGENPKRTQTSRPMGLLMGE